MMEGWLTRANAVLRSHKRLPEVLAAHGNTIRILHTLTPLGVAMEPTSSIPIRIEFNN